MRYIGIFISIIACAYSSLAQDTLLFLTGKSYDCEVIKYEKGQFTVRLRDGSIKDAPASNVKSVQFAKHNQPSNETDSGIQPQPLLNTTTNGPFRKILWGMSQEEVKKTETYEIVKESDDVLAYKDTVAGLDALVLYIFAGERLVRAKYVFVERHSNKNDFIADYKKLGGTLITKYGQPVDNDTTWKDKLYRDDPEDWGTAIAVGHLVMSEKWETADTKIFHIIYGDNFQISHVVEYTSKALESLEEESTSATNKDKL